MGTHATQGKRPPKKTLMNQSYKKVKGTALPPSSRWRFFRPWLLWRLGWIDDRMRRGGHLQKPGEHLKISQNTRNKLRGTRAASFEGLLRRWMLVNLRNIQCQKRFMLKPQKSDIIPEEHWWFTEPGWFSDQQGQWSYEWKKWEEKGKWSSFRKWLVWSLGWIDDEPTRSGWQISQNPTKHLVISK